MAACINQSHSNRDRESFNNFGRSKTDSGISGRDNKRSNRKVALKWYPNPRLTIVYTYDNIKMVGISVLGP